MKIGAHGLLFSAVATLLALQLQAQSPQSFTPVTPCRVVDTRGTQPGALAGGFIAGNSTRTLAIPTNTNCSVPSNVTAYSFNVTVVPRGSVMKWVTLFPTGSPKPDASTLNSYTGLILANAAIVPAGSNGSIDAFATDDTDLILDVNGYFLPVGSSSGTGIALGPNAHAGAFDVSIGNAAGGANESTGGGSANMAIGAGVLTSNSSGSLNVGIGNGALGANTAGNYNTAIGDHASAANTTGNSNVAIGVNALQNNQTGSNNIAIGYLAGQNLGTNNGNNIDIGNQGGSGDNQAIRIGDPAVHIGGTFISGVSGATVPGGIAVIVDSNGHFGTTTSSARFKEDIHDMGAATDKLMLLRPVTFRYKQAASDGSKPLQYGLIAEEVEKTYPELVVHDKDGKIMSVQYQQLPAMLLNEVQKQHTIIDQQTKEIQALEDRLGALESALASQTRSDGNLKQ